MTVNGARALNRSDLGTLDVGKTADLTIVGTERPHMHPTNSVRSNLIYSAGAADVWGVLVDGNILMEDRRITSFDEEETIQQANRRVARCKAEFAEYAGSGDI